MSGKKKILSAMLALCVCATSACAAPEKTTPAQGLAQAECHVKSEENTPFAVETKEINASLNLSFAMDAKGELAQITTLVLDAHIQAGREWAENLSGAFAGKITFGALQGAASPITETKTVYSIGGMPLVVTSGDARSRLYLFTQVTPASAKVEGEISGKGLAGMATKALIDQFKKKYSDPAEWKGDIRVYIAGERGVLEYETQLGTLQYPCTVSWS